MYMHTHTGMVWLVQYVLVGTLHTVVLIVQVTHVCLHTVCTVRIVHESL